MIPASHAPEVFGYHFPNWLSSVPPDVKEIFFDPTQREPSNWRTRTRSLARKLRGLKNQSQGAKRVTNLPYARGNFRRSRFSRAHPSCDNLWSVSMAVVLDTLRVTGGGRPSNLRGSATLASQGVVLHLDRRLKSARNATWGVSEGLWAAGNAIPLPTECLVCNSLI